MTDHFLTAKTHLSAADAVAALIITDQGRYLLQLRDQKPDIWYPGHWGLFGGAVDAGESAEDALCRELTEELGFMPRIFSKFTSYTFDFGFAGQGISHRTFYEVPLKAAQLPSLTLGEGEEMQAFSAKEILALSRVVPYDAFALWMHISRDRLR